ncbi:MAG: response regulator [Armatimonadota bacterium]
MTDPQPNGSHEMERALNSGTNAKRPGRILVVDDELGMREGCRRILEPEGHAVTVAESAEGALAIYTPGSQDLALLDLRMPGMSGIELLARLQQLDPGLICVMITAYATLETAVQATKSGAYDYLAKPFTPDELLLAVDKALERHWLRLEAAQLREQAERSLLLVSTEQSRTRTIIQSMADGVLVTNREGSVVLYNPSLLRLLGIKTEMPAPGQPPSPDLFPQQLLDWMAQAWTGGDVTMAAHELPGGPPDLAANIAPIRDEAGDRLGIVTVLRDITELKSLQQAMSDFVAMVAHELRSPLGAISQYLDVLKAGIVKDPEKEKQIITRCRERTGALSQLVRDLLDFSVMQRRGQADRSVVPLNVADVIRETVEFLAPQAAEKNISVSVDLPGDLFIEADRAEMGRLFTNLLTNALKYNREGGSVAFSAHTTDGYVGITVADTGLGISSAALPRLGEAFFRVKTPQTSQITGTGLGLSICKQIVAAHDGHLEIESEEGKGSTFQVLLPRRRAVG